MMQAILEQHARSMHFKDYFPVDDGFASSIQADESNGNEERCKWIKCIYFSR